jgi:kinetochore protein Mis12/MTW1
MHERLRSLRQTLMASYQLNRTLKQQATANDKMLEQLRRYVTEANGSSTANPHTAFSLLSDAKGTKDAAGYAASQISMIRELVKQVKPKYEALLTHVCNERDGAATTLSTDSERKQYIEKMTRRHMESSRGLRLSARGEVIGGDFEVDKKKSAD